MPTINIVKASRILPRIRTIQSLNLRVRMVKAAPMTTQAGSQNGTVRITSQDGEKSTLSAYGKQHVAAGIGRMTDFVLKTGKGCRVTLDDGREMLDMTSGIGVTNLGHCHPKVSAAAAEQCMTLVHGQCNIAFHEPMIKLIEALKPTMPDPSLDTFFFWNSGSEAVEAAVKLARHATKRPNVIVMQGSYHGRTFGAMALTKSKTIYSQGYSPLMPGVFAIPFPYAHQMGLPNTTPTEELVQSCLFQLELLLSQQSSPSDTAAILLEPVIGEGGYVPAPKSFLEGLRKVCDKHGILLMIDEVQSGFGRTGTYFQIAQSGVKPDVLICAKGIANGFPLSLIVSRKELMDRQPTGSMGGTYGGNAVSCAAALAVVKVFEEERILDNVAARSKQAFTFLNELAKSPKVGHLISEVRGSGLMIGIEFASPDRPFTQENSQGKNVPPKLAALVSKACLDRGMLILTTSVFEVIRMIPPLNVSEAELKEALEVFKDALESVV